MAKSFLNKTSFKYLFLLLLIPYRKLIIYQLEKNIRLSIFIIEYYHNFSLSIYAIFKKFHYSIIDYSIFNLIARNGRSKLDSMDPLIKNLLTYHQNHNK